MAWRLAKGWAKIFSSTATYCGKSSRRREQSDEDTVIEIGPGLGVLTWALADAARTVVAVEVDAGLVRWLTELMQERDNVHVVAHGCATSRSASALRRPSPRSGRRLQSGGQLAVLHYDAAAHALFGGKFARPHDVVMVQREVAQRMTARPGTKEYGASSVAIQLRADVELVTVVSPHVFFPKPAVESAVVRLSLRPFRK